MLATLPAPAPVATFVAPAVDPRFTVESALHELLNHVRDLRAGAGVFAVLSPEDRAEQLAQLIDTGAYMPVDEHVRALGSDQLIDLIGNESTPLPRLIAATREIERRLKILPITPAPADTDAPDADERYRIESDDEQYHRELTMARELDVQLDTPLHGRTGWAV